MKASESGLLVLLKNSPQFAIPIYQRTYSWTDKDCRQLWDDIMRAGSDVGTKTHFIGSIVYVQDGDYHLARQPALLVIDGQQRLTTVTLLLEALARKLGSNEPVNGFSARKIRSYYLLNDLEDDERRFKLILTQTDKDTLLSLLQGRKWSEDSSLRIRANYEFFEHQLARLGDDLSAVCSGLAKLTVVDISLNREQDNPQLIFESMNSTGKELSQADLIRNYVLMGVEQKTQTELYQEYWRPMELAFGQKAYETHFDGFMRHYLTLKTGEIPNVNAVYQAFKAYSGQRSASASGVTELLSDLRTHAEHYCAMALGREPNKQLAEAFRDLRELKVDVAYPLLLQLYHDRHLGLLTSQQLLDATRLVESYVFRRAVCSAPTNSLNRVFAQIGRGVDKEHYLESLQDSLLRQPSYRRFPDDEEFMRELKARDLYNFRSRGYWLRRLENHARKEPVPVEEYTIEHILPQTDDLSQKWQNDLGANWRQIQQTWLHTLGNLTLTGYNSEYGARSFDEKREMRGGFRESPLLLNKDLGTREKWDEQAIHARADRLAARALQVWFRPKPSPGSTVTETSRRSTGYTIDDHEYLAEGRPMRALFQELRREILAIDPTVNEEYLKVYVAYKAETNFVDVVPQVKQLRLMLNMPFHEVHDPRGLCRDVSAIGRWGNGDVELGIADRADLPYALGLIRQAFAWQMVDEPS